MSRGGKKKGGERTLTQELAAFLKKTLVPDLRERAKVAAVRGALEKRYQHEKAQSRTAEHFEGWVERTVEQVGAAWVLSCLFVRTLEDRGMLDHRRLAGPGAADSEQLFFELAPALTARDYLLTVFRELARLPAGDAVMDPKHNPVWRLSPSHDAARALLDFFRAQDTEGALRWTFGGTDTRFLGDVYQDLSESVRERYALLQTPHFVERFILDLTLEPAIQEFGLEKARLIDPTCGSGHFLLGAFERLFEHRQRTAPGLDVKVHAGEALKQVYGVDLNPYAVAIARFRLTLAYLEKAGITKLKNAPRLPLNLVVADSLLYGGRHQQKLSEMDEDKSRWGDEVFDLEDKAEARRIFGQRYHAVVGNPPYITCKDAALRDAYRQRYDSCYREFALAAPFTERFFDLAEHEAFVGLINANSFMKREFGKRLIQEVLPRYELTRVIDTSGAYIPGHGTPTVLLFGRNRKAIADSVEAVMGRRGESSPPDEAEKGLVWTSIESNFNQIGFENEFISVSRIANSTLAKHPWSLGGGGASELKALLETRHSKRLNDLVELIGYGAITREDEVFELSPGASARWGIAPSQVAPYVEGESLRDWSLFRSRQILFPYLRDRTCPPSMLGRYMRVLWCYRAQLWLRQGKGFKTKRESGGEFYEYSMFYPNRHFILLRIAFAFMATHNHFVLDRGGRVFNRSTPVVKLPDGSTENDHLALLGYLNSSTACFWMKQVFFDKGNRGEGGGITAESWEKFFDHDSTKLQSIPCPSVDPRLVHMAKLLDEAACSREKSLPEAAVDKWRQDGGDLKEILEAYRTQCESLEGKIRWLQEELDWLVYRLSGLSSLDIQTPPQNLDVVPERAKGTRPSDIRYARQAQAGDVTERYFQLCHLPSSAEILEYQVGEVDQQRLQAIEASGELQLLEVPVYKRTFREGHRPWSPDAALRAEIASVAEQAIASIGIATGPVPFRSLLQSARKLLFEMAAMLTKSEEEGQIEQCIREIVVGQAVPYLAAWRHTATGMEKRAAWEEAWQKQRLEDDGEEVTVSVPPRYGAEDYRAYSYFQMRGKLDVPKERFILYPGCERDNDRNPLLGWAGWDHLQQANALAALYQERKLQDGWDAARLTPLLAGLLELVPWLKQWHNVPDPEFNGERLGDYYAQFIDSEARALGLSLDQLRSWRPKQGTSRKNPARRKKTATAEDAS